VHCYDSEDKLESRIFVLEKKEIEKANLRYEGKFSIKSFERMDPNLIALQPNILLLFCQVHSHSPPV